MKKFLNAYNGILFGLRDFSIVLQILIGIVVLVISLVLKLDALDFMIVLMLIFMVVVTEFINTSIEEICNLITLEHNLKVKKIKDLAAASVLLMSFLSFVIGIMIFIKYI